MEKEKYVMPQAIEEAFVANSYCSNCGTHVTGKNGMRCINPYHNHYNSGYFTYVWIDAPGSVVCETHITKSTPKSDGEGGGGMSISKNDACLFKDGHTEYATTKVNVWKVGSYYVPASVATSEWGDCYGSYRFDGTYIDKVLS